MLWKLVLSKWAAKLNVSTVERKVILAKTVAKQRYCVQNATSSVAGTKSHAPDWAKAKAREMNTKWVPQTQMLPPPGIRIKAPNPTTRTRKKVTTGPLP